MLQLKNVEGPVRLCFDAETPEAVIKECPNVWKGGTLGAKKCRFVLYARRLLLEGCDTEGIDSSEEKQEARTRDFRLFQRVAEHDEIDMFIKLRIMGWMLWVMSSRYPKLISRLEEGK